MDEADSENKKTPGMLYIVKKLGHAWDISASYDLLEDSLENLKSKILQEYIPNCSKQGKVDEIQIALQILKKIENHMKELSNLRNSYKEIFSSYIIEL